MRAMAQTGNPTSVIRCRRELMYSKAVMGSYLNVKINASSLDDKAFVDEIIKKQMPLSKKPSKRRRNFKNSFENYKITKKDEVQ